MATTIGAPGANITTAATNLLGAVQQLVPQAQQQPAAAPQDAFVGPAAGNQAAAAPAGGQDQLTQALGALVGMIQQLVTLLGGGAANAGAGQAAATATATAGGATATATAGASAAAAATSGATSSGLPATSGPSSSSPAPATGDGVFVIGDMAAFGGRTVRQGLTDMLRPTQGLKDRAGERTHSQLSPAQAQQVQALLNSTDPNVQATLDTAVPHRQSLVISQDGRILETLNTKDDVVGNQSLNVGAHAQHMNDGAPRNYDRSAGGQLSSQAGGYNVIGTELHSPIKIALDGQNAQLDSTHGFKLDANGFGAKGGDVTTSGGLNPNEAWLVRDKDGTGISKNGVVNGNDVYGDHNGQFKDGYQELARDYQSELKTDPATGHQYIDLTDPNSRAAKELKLLDSSGKSVPASSVLNRIDVTAMDTKEADATGANQIRERANVTYKDGHTASSADQWYAQRPAGK